MEASSSRLSRLLNLVALLTETSRPLTRPRDPRAASTPTTPTTTAVFRRQLRAGQGGAARPRRRSRRRGDPRRRPARARLPRRPRPVRPAASPTSSADEVGRPAARRLARPPRRARRRHRAAGRSAPAAVPRRGRGGASPRCRPTPQLGLAVRRSGRAPHRDASTTAGERRTVDPYRLDFARGRWYLLGLRPRPRGRALVPSRPHRRRARARTARGLRRCRRPTSPDQCPIRGCSVTPSR